jgi:hypothetical protein
MNRLIVVLLLGGLLFVTGCSRPTAEAPAVTSPTPLQQSNGALQRERKATAKSLEAQVMKAEPMTDQPIMAVSPSPSASPMP